MDSNIYNNDELYHHGVVGMKWGVRRYQRKDVSLTPAGEKRRAKIESELKSRERVIKNKERVKAKFDKLNAKKSELDKREDALGVPKKTKGIFKKKPAKSENSSQKSIKDMTDDELREHTARMQLEKNYYDAQRNLAIANPPKISAGQKFMNSLVNDVVAPAAKNAGREWLEKTLKEKLGIKEEHKKTIDELTKEFNLKVAMKDEYKNDLDRAIQIRKKEAALREMQAQEKADAARAKAQEKAAEAQAKAQKAAEKQAKEAQREAERQAKEAQRQAEKAQKEAERQAKEVAAAAEKAAREAEAAKKASAAANKFISNVQNKPISNVSSNKNRKRVQAMLEADDYDFTNWGRYSRDWDRWDDD